MFSWIRDVMYRILHREKVVVVNTVEDSDFDYSDDIDIAKVRSMVDAESNYARLLRSQLESMRSVRK